MKISNLEQLQKLYGEAHPATAEKKSATLIKKAIDFIKKSPFIVLSTAAERGSSLAPQRETRPDSFMSKIKKHC